MTSPTYLSSKLVRKECSAEEYLTHATKMEALNYQTLTTD